MINILVANGGDLKFVLQQQRLESNALGFVPDNRLRWEIGRGRVLVALAGRMKLGYAYLGSGRSGRVPIYQLVTEAGVRRRAIGEALVDEATRIAAADGCWGVSCRCRDDLDANAFWAAIGCIRMESTPGGAGRGRMVHRYVRAVPSIRAGAGGSYVGPAIWRGLDG